MSVNDPENELADVPLQNILALFMVAPAATAEALPPTVADDLGPPSGQPSPLSPGPAARAGEAPGAASVVARHGPDETWAQSLIGGADLLGFLAVGRPTALTGAKAEAVILRGDDALRQALEGRDHDYYANDEPIADRLFAWIKDNRGSVQVGGQRG